MYDGERSKVEGGEGPVDVGGRVILINDGSR